MKTLIYATLSLAMVASVPAASKEKIVFASRDAVIAKSMIPTVERFKAAYPDIEVELLNLNYSGLYEKISVNMREKTGAIDVVLLDDPWVTEFTQRGWLRKLGSTVNVDGDFVKSALDLGRVDGDQYALPWNGNVQMFAYRKDLFAAAGLKAPVKFSDMLAAAQKVAGPGMKGLVFRGAKGNPIVTGFLPLLWAFGGDVVDANGKVTIGDAATVAAIEMLLKLKADAPVDVASYDSGEVRDALQQGKAAMSLEVWPAWVPDLDNPAVSKTVGKVDLVPMPGEVRPGTPMLGLWLLGVASDSKHAKAAETFINFALSPENEMKEVVETGKPPVRRSSFTNAEAVAKYRWLPTQLASLEAGRPKPRVPNWNQVESVIGDYLSLALTGQMSPKEAAEQMNRSLIRILPKPKG